MNANELMIGNLIFSDLYNNTPILVESICSINKDIFNLTTGEIPFTSLIPIPLTEEWLLDFGFYISNNSDITKWYSNNIFSVCRNKDYFHFRLIENRESKFLLNIDYVHQLQNLYFSLTGTHLQLVSPK